MKHCLFCKTTLNGQNKTKEHIFPTWLLEKLEFFGTMKGKETTYPNVPERVFCQRDVFSKSFVYGKICNKCNNNWMSNLEQKVQPIILYLLESAYYHLNVEQCNILSNWVFKTAIVLNAASKYKQVIPLSQINYFYQNLMIPENVKIDLAFCPGNRLHYYLGGNKLFSKSSLDISNKEMNDSYVISIQIDYLLFRISWSPNPMFQTLPIPDELVKRLFPLNNSLEFKKGAAGMIFKDIEQFHFSNTIFVDFFATVGIPANSNGGVGG